MNPSAAAALFTFLLIMITFNYPLPTAARRPPLIDTHGNLVHSGTRYLIVPATHHGGGLTLAPTTNHTQYSSCQLDVIQSKSPLSHGLPVTFTPTSAGDKHRRHVVIFGAMDLNIQFAASSTCGKSTVWKVQGGSHHHDAQKWFVTAGGEKWDAARGTAGNSFKIFRVKQGKGPVLFRIVFCSSTCEGCHVSCKGVRIFVDVETGARRLALTDHGPLLVQFKKV